MVGLCLTLIAAAPSCAPPLDRSAFVACVLERNPEILAARARVRAAQARITSATPILPENPEITVQIAHRQSASASALNWYVALAQPIEIGGQRGPRLAGARAEHDADAQRAKHTVRRVIAGAEAARLGWLAARERQMLVASLEEALRKLAEAVAAHAQSGVASTLDAEVAYAEYVLFAERRAKLELEVAAESSRVAAALDMEKAPEITGGLEPLAIADAVLARPIDGSEAPLARAARADADAHRAAASLRRRSRVPSPTLLFTAQNDGFDERVYGGGIAVRIPLPDPVGHAAIGEARMEDAHAEEAEHLAADEARRGAAELERAIATYASLRARQALYPADRVAGARRSLLGLADAVASGRVTLREVTPARQALLGLLEAALDARVAWALASVRVAELGDALVLP
ncbi:MAG: TolC family protein [Deltaproteobacteria bacterium]|nr:TolC family protein [Deltaproteobacteria bacterium]